MNILVLTTIYKDPDDSEDSATTPIVYNFAKKWKQSGHNVVVIHNFNRFLYPLYFTPKGILNYLSNKVGFRASLNIAQTKEKHYTQDGVEVYRLPILKVIPRGKYRNQDIKKQQRRIESILSRLKYNPDIIVGHAENPQIYQLYHLKKKYPCAKTGIVFHGIEYLNRKEFIEWKNTYLDGIDEFGFRSEAIHRLAQNTIGFDRKYFLCPSGIADCNVVNTPLISHKIRRFIFV